jgi:hypothetical protein
MFQILFSAVNHRAFQAFNNFSKFLEWEKSCRDVDSDETIQVAIRGVKQLTVSENIDSNAVKESPYYSPVNCTASMVSGGI